MRVSAKADYAVRAMIALAASDGGEPVKGTEIADAQDIPMRFLEHILAELRHGGLVLTAPGDDESFRLAEPASDVTVAEVIEAVDGPLASIRGHLPEDLEYGGGAASLRDVWAALGANVRQVLESVSLADVVAGKLPDAVAALSRGPGGRPAG